MGEKDAKVPPSASSRPWRFYALSALAWLGLAVWASYKQGSIQGIAVEIEAFSKLGLFLLLAPMYLVSLSLSRYIEQKMPQSSLGAVRGSNLELSKRGEFIQRLWVLAWVAGSGLVLGYTMDKDSSMWPWTAMILMLLGVAVFLLSKQQAHAASVSDISRHD